MLNVTIITCVLFQTSIAIYLLRVSRLESDFERCLEKLLFILLGHLCTKFFLLAILQNVEMYSKITSGFGLSYGPLLLVATMAYLQKPLSRKAIMLHLAPFLFFTAVYIIFITGLITQSIPLPVIVKYNYYYQFLVTASLFLYPLIIKVLLHNQHRQKRSVEQKLLLSISNVFIGGVFAGMLCFATGIYRADLPSFDLRIIPYICFISIPVFVLRYKFQQKAANAAPLTGPAANAAPHLSPGSGNAASSQSQLTTGIPSFPQQATVPSGQFTTPVTNTSHTLPETSIEEPEKRYQKSGLDQITLATYEAKLKSYMQQHQIYLDTELSLESLAQKLNIPKHHVTQLLNDRLHKSFYRFVNEYRINHAMEKLKDQNTEFNLLSLAYDCGFNSKSSFNNYFKQLTGHTPSAYRKMYESPLPAKI